MRKIHCLLFLALLCLITVACKKELSFKPGGTSSLTLVNALAGTDYLFTNFNGDKSNGQYYSGMMALRYGNIVFFNSYSGKQDLGLYKAPDTNANSRPVMRLEVDLRLNAIHTLFLTGSTQDPDYLLTTDQLPYHLPADSVMGLRFINISKGSDPVSVNLEGQAKGSEIAALSYKAVSGFKDYKAGKAVSSYTFEFRDKTSGTLLGSYKVEGINNDGSPTSPNIRRNRNYTIAFVGTRYGNTSSPVLIVDEAIKN